MLQERLDMSERRACRIVGQYRSTQRREVTRGKGDDALRARLHAFSVKHKRWGYQGMGAAKERGLGCQPQEDSSGCGGRRA